MSVRHPWDRAALACDAERAKAVHFVELASAPASALRPFREVRSRRGYDVFHGAGTLVVIDATAPEAVPDCSSLVRTSCWVPS
ncbi:MAG TPA: hypothetical protein VIK54_17310, partial [Acidimicrobiia bacterium]